MLTLSISHLDSKRIDHTQDEQTCCLSRVTLWFSVVLRADSSYIMNNTFLLLLLQTFQ